MMERDGAKTNDQLRERARERERARAKQNDQ